MPRYVCRLVLLFVPDSVVSKHKDNEQSTQFYTSFPVWVLQVKYGLNFFFFLHLVCRSWVNKKL